MKLRTGAVVLLIVLCLVLIAEAKEQLVTGEFQLQGRKKISDKPCNQKKHCSAVKEYCFMVKKDDGEVLALTARLATKHDLDPVLGIYRDMTEEDRGSVITFPGDFQRKFLEKSIDRQHLFIVETEDKKVVSLLKLFLIKGQKKLEHILSSELRILPSLQLMKPVLQEKRSFCSNMESLVNYSLSLDTPVLNDCITCDPELWDVSKSASIYCGSCLTRKEFRGLGIGSKLKDFAFETIRGQVIQYVHAKGSTRVCLLFGQVNEAYHQQGLIRAFMSFIFSSSELVKKQSDIVCIGWSYLANLPQFIFGANDALVEIEESVDTWKDYGCVVAFDIV